MCVCVGARAEEQMATPRTAAMRFHAERFNISSNKDVDIYEPALVGVAVPPESAQQALVSDDSDDDDDDDNRHRVVIGKRMLNRNSAECRDSPRKRRKMTENQRTYTDGGVARGVQPRHGFNEDDDDDELSDREQEAPEEHAMQSRHASDRGRSQPAARGYQFPSAPSFTDEARGSNILVLPHVRKLAPVASFSYLDARKRDGHAIMDGKYISKDEPTGDSVYTAYINNYSAEQPWGDVINAYITNTYVRQLELDKSPHWNLMKRLNGRLSASDLNAALNLAEMDGRALRIREALKREVEDQMRRLNETDRARKLMEAERVALEQQQRLLSDPGVVALTAQAKLTFAYTEDERVGFERALRNLLGYQHLFVLFGLWKNGNVRQANNPAAVSMNVTTELERQRSRVFQLCVTHLRQKENLLDTYNENKVDVLARSAPPTVTTDTINQLLRIQAIADVRLEQRLTQGESAVTSTELGRLFSRLRGNRSTLSTNAAGPAVPPRLGPVSLDSAAELLLTECSELDAQRVDLSGFVGNVNVIGAVMPLPPATREALQRLSLVEPVASLPERSTVLLLEMVQAYVDEVLFPPVPAPAPAAGPLARTASYEQRVRAAFDNVARILQNAASAAAGSSDQLGALPLWDLAEACWYAHAEVVRFDTDDLRYTLSHINPTDLSEPDQEALRNQVSTWRPDDRSGKLLRALFKPSDTTDAGPLPELMLASETETMISCINVLRLFMDDTYPAAAAAADNLTRQYLQNVIQFCVYYGVQSLLKAFATDKNDPNSPVVVFDQPSFVVARVDNSGGGGRRETYIQAVSSLFVADSAKTSGSARTDSEVNPTRRRVIYPILGPDQLNISANNDKLINSRMTLGKAASGSEQERRRVETFNARANLALASSGREWEEQYELSWAARYFSAASWIQFTRAHNYVSLTLAPIALVFAHNFVRLFLGTVVSAARVSKLRTISELKLKIDKLEKITNPLDEITQLLKDSDARSQLVNALSESLHPRNSGLYVFKDNRCVAFEKAQAWIQNVGSEADVRWQYFSFEGLLHKDPHTNVPNTESDFCSFFLDVVHMCFRDDASVNGALIRTRAMSQQEKETQYALMRQLFQYVPLDTPEQYKTQVPKKAITLQVPHKRGSVLSAAQFY